MPYLLKLYYQRINRKIFFIWKDEFRLIQNQTIKGLIKKFVESCIE